MVKEMFAELTERLNDCLYNGRNNLFHLTNFPSIAIFVSKDIKCCWKVLRFYQNRTLP